MITIDEASRALAPDIVEDCDELERKIDKAIRGLEPGPRSVARVDAGNGMDLRVVSATRRRYERAGWFVRIIDANHGGFIVELRLCPADEAAIYPFG
jgi:hypothetical protein